MTTTPKRIHRDSQGTWPSSEPRSVRTAAEAARRGDRPMKPTTIKPGPDDDDAQADSDGYHGQGC